MWLAYSNDRRVEPCMFLLDVIAAVLVVVLVGCICLALLWNSFLKCFVCVHNAAVYVAFVIWLSGALFPFHVYVL